MMISMMTIKMNMAIRRMNADEVFIMKIHLERAM